MISVFAQRLAPRAFTLIVFETGLIVLAVWAAAYVRLGQWTWEVLWTPHGIWKVLLVSAVCQMCLYYADLYDFRRLADRREIFTRVTGRWARRRSFWLPCISGFLRWSSAAACS